MHSGCDPGLANEFLITILNLSSSTHLKLLVMKSLQIILLSFLLLSDCFSPLQAQDVSKSKLAFGVRFGANFDNIYLDDFQMDYWLLRSTPGLFIEYKNHDLLLGVTHTHFLNNPGWVNGSNFDPSLGISLGYRYYPNEIIKRLRMFAQLQGSHFRVNYSYRSPGGFSEHKETVWCGYTSVGIDYRIYQGLHAFTGAGIGISSTFHNHTSIFYPHVMAGIDYRFSVNRK